MQGLDGLRAIAVACVLVAHASDSPDNPTLLYRIALELRLGALGVKLFFVISGFIITWLLLREERRHGDISLRFFWLRRSVRIIPPLAGYLAVVFLLSFFFQHIAPNPRDYLAAITFSWGWWADVENWWVGHTWSLSIEEQFYLVWPLLFAFLTMRKRFVLLTAGSILLVLLFSLLATLFPQWGFWSAYLLPSNFVFLAVGCLLAVLLTTNHKWLVSSAVRTETRKIILGVSLMLFARVATKWLGFPSVLASAFEATGLALIVWMAVVSQSWVARFLALRPMVWVGTISYSLYLWQQLFLGRFGQPVWQQFPLNLVMTFATAFLSYQCLERPFFALRERWKRQ